MGTPANVNCLENVRCPNCGNSDKFYVIGTALFEITDDGVEIAPDAADIEYEDDARAFCPDCPYEGAWETFQLCGEHGEDEPTCDICERGQCFTPEMEWNGETGLHVECEQKLALAKKATPGGCVEDNAVTCGICDAAWCEECDPAPSALCHYCHGRGYSTAEIRPPRYAR